MEVSGKTFNGQLFRNARPEIPVIHRCKLRRGGSQSNVSRHEKFVVQEEIITHDQDPVPFLYGWRSPVHRTFHIDIKLRKISISRRRETSTYLDNQPKCAGTGTLCQSVIRRSYVAL
jgi:hypothetical protein